MPVPIETIIERMEWAARHQLAEYAWRADGHRVTIKRTADEALPAPAGAAAPTVPAQPTVEPSTSGDTSVSAPLAGLCHLRPEVGGVPFVNIGDQVEVGQTICIIEAMKMMTSIPAEVAGRVEAIFVTDGDTVAAGAPLMRIS